MADETVFLGGTVTLDPIQTITGLDWHIPAPTGLDATDGDHTDKVAITWSAVTGASHYLVYRSATSGGTYTLIASPTATSYDDEGVTAGTTYFYKVRAIRPTNREGELSSYDSGYAEDEPSLNVEACLLATGCASLINEVSAVVYLCGDVTADLTDVAKVVYSTSAGTITDTSATFYYSSSTEVDICPSTTFSTPDGFTFHIGVKPVSCSDYIGITSAKFYDSSDNLLQSISRPLSFCQYIQHGVAYSTNYYDDCP